MSAQERGLTRRVLYLALWLPLVVGCTSTAQREGLPALEAGLNALHRGQYDVAREYCSSAAEFRGEDDSAAACLLVAALHLGHYRQALSVVEGLEAGGDSVPGLSLELRGRLSTEKVPMIPPYPVNLAWACWWGHCSFDRDQVLASETTDVGGVVDVAMALVRSGAVDSALQLLEGWHADGSALELAAQLKIRSGDLPGAILLYDSPAGRVLDGAAAFLSFLRPASKTPGETSVGTTGGADVLRQASRHRTRPAVQLSAAAHLIRSGRSGEALRYIERAGEATGDSRLVVLYRLFVALLAEDRELARSLSHYLKDSVPAAWKGWILRLSAAL